ncbi:hypothetical protein [Pedobacter frigiditerrae]|uniref:glycine-rich domain-containing protein n=1 Tax=Pedobacter frigiditerrae TaxID=2530452 RepID=UPI002931E50D|nr:hypothetical protein [Pedobacter frigiditerrae]
MNTELWDKIVQFDFDNPPSEYGFSTRLANENYWTKDFTEKAILEYKKFMYLAATSEFMVSPSETIDIVWHQHLIFTQSYQEFCDLIGKQIQHIPSTHNKEDFSKFKQAKERTIKFYENTFGTQPSDIWEFEGMYESLNLNKAKLKLRTFIIIGILSVIILIAPFYLLLKPIYITINNPDFILYFIGLVVITVIILEIYNKDKLKIITRSFDKNSFIYSLQPFELVYLQTQQLSKVINGAVNELIDDETIKVNTDNTVKLVIRGETKSSEQLQVATTLSEIGKTAYPILLTHLLRKPIFWNIVNAMEAFKKYFIKSKKFSQLFYLNFGILSTLLMLGSIRLITGILREKPVIQIGIVVIILTIIIIYYLNRLTNMICMHTIPNLYKTHILPAKDIENDWQWNYFLFGSAVLTTTFIPLVNYADRNNNDGGSSCGSSSSSSCGSSCSSCGGCGGD